MSILSVLLINIYSHNIPKTIINNNILKIFLLLCVAYLATKNIIASIFALIVLLILYHTLYTINKNDNTNIIINREIIKEPEIINNNIIQYSQSNNKLDNDNYDIINNMNHSYNNTNI